MAGYETAGRTPLEFFLEGIVFGGLRQSLRIRSAESPQLGVGVRLLMHCFQYFLPPVALSEPWGGRWWGGGEAMAIGIVSPDSRSDQQGSRPLGAAPLLVSSSAEKLAGPPAAFRTATVSGGRYLWGSTIKHLPVLADPRSRRPTGRCANSPAQTLSAQ
jgi:hypothetical protein